MRQCDIVMVTWNQLEYTKRCIKSLMDSTEFEIRLIIVDNKSSDGTREYLLSLKDSSLCKFEVILNNKNKGFGEGINQGIKISEAPFVCLSNNDLIFTKGWLQEIISLFEKYREIGILNPNSNNLGVSPPNGIRLERFAKDLRDKYKGIFVEMPFCVGFCIVVKKEVIQEIGGYSKEFYPFFFEDTDYSMKAQKAGYLIGLAKGSYVWHMEHASLVQMGERKEKIFAEKRKLFFKKWGRIIRIAFVINSYQDLNELLPKAINLARDGNYLWIFTRSFDVDRNKVFNEFGFIEHAGINFVRFRNNCDFLRKVIIKKKKYDLIIAGSKDLASVVQKFGLLHKAEAFDTTDVELIKTVLCRKKFECI